MSKTEVSSDTREIMDQGAFERYMNVLKTAFEKGDFRTVMQASYTVAEKYFEAAKAATDENPEIGEQLLMAIASRYVLEECMPNVQSDLDAIRPLPALLAEALKK
jgi:hypothetical protein